jgi:hypothetical protein
VIVAAFPLSSSAADALSEDAPVSTVVLEGAQMLGIDVASDRARFMAEFTRLLYSRPESKNPVVALIRAGLIGRQPPSDDPSVVVPVPLTAELWSREVFGRAVPPGALIDMIAADRRAALICHTLAGLDDETLNYLADQPGVLRRLYERDAAAFAGFGAGLQVLDGRVVPAGGELSIPLWEAVVGQSVNQPGAFIEALFSLHSGHIAYLFDVVAHLDEPHARFVLGAWLPDSAERLEHFVALATVLAAGYEGWDLGALPFSRPLNDLSFLVMRVRVDSSGHPLPPASRAFWSRALDASGSTGDDDMPVDAAWLAHVTGAGDYYSRGDRVEQVGFGQRVFGGASPDQWADAVAAVRAFPRQQMLMLALERMGIRSPALYAAAAERGARAASLHTERSHWTLAQLQGALAIVSRLTVNGSADVATAERLVSSLIRVEFDHEGRYDGRIADWVVQELVPILPGRRNVEEQLIWGMAGPSPGATARRLLWEGQEYVVDLPAAERSRLAAVRGKQAGATVDLALALHGVTRRLGASRTGPDRVRAAANDMNEVLALFSPSLAGAGSAESRKGVVHVTRVLDEATELRDELAAAAAGDVARARLALPRLTDLLESLLGEALLAWAYAADIGDPSGTALLARNVALRHDFGSSRVDGASLLSGPWALPRQSFLPGVPWHISGSVLGLDLAMASMALRRAGLDGILQAPQIPSNERQAFPVGVALLDPSRLRDTDRDAIASAIATGRARVEAVARGDAPLKPVARAISMDGWRRREIRWMLEHDREAIPSKFALVDLLVLGGAGQLDLNSWGLAANDSYGCLCTKLIPTRAWRLFGGRPRLGLMASFVSDLNLRVAMMLAELQVPSELAKAVLAAAVLDFINSAEATDPNDWWALSLAGRQVSRERIEDYVAAAAVDGPLVPYESDSAGAP